MIYITGNHDEALRRYSDMHMGNFQLTDKVVMEINGKMTWIFHGDVFDATTKGSAKLLAKLGGHGYDLLILINSLINRFLKLMGKEKMSFSKKVKNSVKKAVSWIGNFEQTAANWLLRKSTTMSFVDIFISHKKESLVQKKGLLPTSTVATGSKTLLLLSTSTMNGVFINTMKSSFPKRLRPL